MHYKGVVFLLGPPPARMGMESLRAQDSNWEVYFDELKIITPKDGIIEYQGRSGVIDYTPMVGIKGEDSILFCPVRPAAYLKRNGNIRTLDMQETRLEL